MAIPNNWVMCQSARPSAALKLFCFPYGGGGASAFRNWAHDLDSNVEVCCVQLPGRENRLREPPSGSIEELVPVLAEGMLPEMDRPFAFYGHSLGAKIAFETARELRRKGTAQPIHIFAAASPAPQLPWLHPHTHGMAEPDFIDEIQKRYGGVPSQIIEDPEMRALLIPALRADLQMVETCRYTPEPPLDCAITAFGGIADRAVGRSEMEAWREQTRNTFRLHMLAGDHFFLQSQRQELLGLIRAALRASRLR